MLSIAALDQDDISWPEVVLERFRNPFHAAPGIDRRSLQEPASVRADCVFPEVVSGDEDSPSRNLSHTLLQMPGDGARTPDRLGHVAQYYNVPIRRYLGERVKSCLDRLLGPFDIIK